MTTKQPSSLSTISEADFEFVKVIGRGSFGKVVKVAKKDTGAIYAAKILRKDAISAYKLEFAALMEKLVLQHVDHPFIVKLHCTFQDEKRLYFVLDFLSGGELFCHLQQKIRFELEAVKFYMAEIVLALEHLHSNNIVYNDLKPENIVLDGDGHAILTDFGLAQFLQDDEEHGGKRAFSNGFFGTAGYAAPEIIQGQSYTQAADWWSLGVLLYELLVGRPPFYSTSVEETKKKTLHGKLKFPSFVPEDAQHLIACLLERDQEKRLGASGDADDIKTHPFFQDINWEDLYSRKLTPPFIPTPEEEYSFFNLEFTSEEARLSEAEPVEKGDKFVQFDAILSSNFFIHKSSSA